MKKKVIIGMSGGVDSSAAAALLLEQGYDVIGVTFSLWDNADAIVADAKRVADHLGIPFYALDCREEFLHHVVEPFSCEYTNGRTPNPCVECNRHIKFRFLMDAAKRYGADHIATGHYARVEQENGRYRLYRCADEKKDQTYFLYTLSQEILAKVLFPLYGTEKTDVRRIAEQYKIPTAQKKESQEICFVPDNDHGRFISEYLGVPSIPGDFVMPDGTVPGQHRGIIHYTIGQRRWLGISLGRRIFVTDIDPKNNTVTLGEDGDLFRTTLYASAESWIAGESPSLPLRCTAKVRYGAKEAHCTVSRHEDGLRIVFDAPQRAMTPGQSVVFYNDDAVLGGAVADKAE